MLLENTLVEYLKEQSAVNPLSERDQKWEKGEAPDVFKLDDREPFYFEYPNHETAFKYQINGYSYHTQQGSSARQFNCPKEDRLGFSN